MSNTKNTPVRRLVLPLVLTGILPVAVMVLGTVLLLGDSILTGSFAITYFLLPALAWAGSFFAVRSRLRRGWKILVVALIAVVFVWLLLQMMLFGHYAMRYRLQGEEALKEYGAVALDMPALPMPSQLGNPGTVEYRYFFNLFGMFFDTECHTLICTYTPEHYREELQRLEETYVFQQPGRTSAFFGEETTATVDGFRFSFLSFENGLYPLQYPKYVVLIGVNGETGQIAYLYCNDDDLDYISSLQDYILEDCGWERFQR